MLILDLIYNLAILVVLCVLSGFLNQRVHYHKLEGQVLQGFLFGAIAVVGMLYPFEIAEGIIFDGRTIVISVGTLFFGPVTGVIGAAMAVIYRLWLGGGGLAMGLLTISSAFVIGWVFHVIVRPGLSKKSSKIVYLMMGGIVHILMILLMIFLPADYAREVFYTLSVTILVAYPLATVLVGTILEDQIMNLEHMDQLQESERKFRSVVQSTDDIIFTMDRNLRHTGVYGNWLRQLGREESDYLGKTAAEKLGSAQGDFHERHYRKALKGESVLYEWVLPHKGQELHIQSRISPMRDEAGEVIGLVGIGRNITEMVNADQEIEKSLQEKNILLSEIHHRVKNNMAIISSLLTLQSQHTRDPEVQKLFLDTESRVRSMALVHEMIYAQTNYIDIEVSELLVRLAKLLSASYEQEGCLISIDVDSDPVTIEMNSSIPFTLLVNELVTNAYKHAFKGRKSGLIHISLHKEQPEHEGEGQPDEMKEQQGKSATDPQTASKNIPSSDPDDPDNNVTHNQESSPSGIRKYGLRLMVSDNGIGVRDPDILTSPKSFGYTIIHGLARQLRADFSLGETEKGLTVIVRF